MNDMPPPSRVSDEIVSALYSKPAAATASTAASASAAEGPPFPRLRVLSLAGNPGYHGDNMAPLLVRSELRLALPRQNCDGFA